MSRVSPFNDLHCRLGASMAEYTGWQLPSDYGDIPAESQALYKYCAAFDLSGFGKIVISGRDSRKLVEKLLASRTDNLQVGKWIWAIICNEDGLLVDIVRLGSIGQKFLILTSPTGRERIIKSARKCAADNGFGDVRISDQTEKTGMLGIYGPGSVEAIERIVPFDIASMEKNSITTISVFMMSITVIRGSWLGLDGVEILSGIPACKLAGRAVEKYHQREQIQPAGMDCLELALTEASLPLSIRPDSAGLSRLIDFEKDFLGRERLEKNTEAGPDRLLVGLRSEEQRKELPPELKIQRNGLEVGLAERMVWSGKFGKSIGFGMIDNGIYDSGGEVQLWADGFEMTAELVSLPFDKQIAAGIYD